MAATNAQVQAYVDNRLRVRAEQIRNLLIALEDDKNLIDDVYANVSDSPTWTDSRSDNPPHLLGPNDVLAYNSFISDAITALKGHGSYGAILDACVRSPV